MYKKILVPLDGSKLAECALPHAEELARASDSGEVILISATEQLRTRTRAPEARELYGDPDNPGLLGGKPEMTVAFGKKERQADKYLDRIAGKLEADGIKAHEEVLTWPPDEAIVSYAEQNGVDVIVMSSHGRSGASRRAYGRVAERVLKASRVPVLMVRAPGCGPVS
jgi:nucleotide-binding universal stress UspA family protein